MLGKFESRADPEEDPLPPPSRSHRDPTGFDLRTEFYRVFGVDLTAIPTAGDFASWPGLCPDNRITGGKVLSAKTRKVDNPLATSLRLAAQSLHHSPSVLGEFYRRMRYRQGPVKATTTSAHKIARVIHHIVTTGQAYDESVLAHHEHQARARKTRRLQAQAAALGFQLLPQGAT